MRLLAQCLICSASLTLAAAQKPSLQPFQPLIPYITNYEPRLTCDYLKDLELNSYKHIPAFLAKVLPDDATSHEQNEIAGNCFGRIGIRTEFNYLSETSVSASITLSLSSHSSYFCIEHLQFSTTFRDFYKPQFQEGTT